jgi:hypothetical protein
MMKRGKFEARVYASVQQCAFTIVPKTSTILPPPKKGNPEIENSLSNGQRALHGNE